MAITIAIIVDLLTEIEGVEFCDCANDLVINDRIFVAALQLFAISR